MRISKISADATASDASAKPKKSSATIDDAAWKTTESFLDTTSPISKVQLKFSVNSHYVDD